jgi:hypothetical protein
MTGTGAPKTIVGEARATVAVPPRDVFDFVLDLHRYRQADRKIGRVGRIARDGDRGTVEFWGRVRGLPGPRGVYPFTRSPTHLEFESPIAGLARRLMEFRGTFDCEETPQGTVVTHREAYTFKPPLRGLANALLRRWLETDTAGEMIRFKELVERDAAAAPAP